MKQNNIQHRLGVEVARKVCEALGYATEEEKPLGKFKIDLVASKESEQIAFEIIISKKPSIKKIEAVRNVGMRFIPIRPLETINERARIDYLAFVKAITLFQAGKSLSEITKVVGRDQATVFGWVKGGLFPNTLDRERMRNVKEMLEG